MKKLFLYIFLIASTYSFSQSVSFKEIKTINSPKIYQRIMIENGFELTKMSRFDSIAVDFYGRTLSLNYEYVYSNKPKIYSTYYFELSDDGYKVTNEMAGISFDNLEGNNYDEILEEVKNECNFFDIWNGLNLKPVSCYACPGSRYPGKICFAKNSITIMKKSVELDEKTEKLIEILID